MKISNEELELQMAMLEAGIKMGMLSKEEAIEELQKFITTSEEIEEDSINQINQIISSVDKKGEISDGSHTFDELYYHRMVLFSIICNQNKKMAWKSWKHDDDTMFDDYFIVGVTTPDGDYSYHYHKDHWNKFNVKELLNAPPWDGHEPKDIIRLFSLEGE